MTGVLTVEGGINFIHFTQVSIIYIIISLSYQIPLTSRLLGLVFAYIPLKGCVSMLKRVFNHISLSLRGEGARQAFWRTGEGERSLGLTVFLFLFFALSTSCIGIGGTGSTGGSGLTGESPGGGATTEEGGSAGADSGTDSGSTGGGEAMPSPVSIAPSALIADGTRIIVASADSSGYTPTIGYEGAVDTTITYSDGSTSTMTDNDGDGLIDSYYVAVSTTSLEESSVGAALRGRPQFRATT